MERCDPFVPVSLLLSQQAARIRVDGSDSLFRNDFVEGNAYGFRVSISDCLLIGNLAAKNNTNYYFLGSGATGTDYGQIYNEPGPHFTNSNPWANFEQN